MKITPIRKRRLDLNISSESIINSLGISKSFFYKLEQGFSLPSIYLVIKLSKLYKCSTDEIFKEFGLLGGD